jgi:hypothetical protein
MAKFYTELNESLRQFIAAQRIFFNASAPNQGRINLSPKGLEASDPGGDPARVEHPPDVGQ